MICLVSLGLDREPKYQSCDQYLTFEFIFLSFSWSVFSVSHAPFLLVSLCHYLFPALLSLSFSRAQTLTRSDLARFAWDDASLPWNKVVSGWLWTLFLSGSNWVIDRLSNGLGTFSLLRSLLSLVLFSLHHFRLANPDPTGIRILLARGPWKEILYVTQSHDY